MSAVELVIVLLATWRLAAFLAYERWTDGLRLRMGVEMVDENGVPVSFWGKVFGCFWCLSLPAAVVCAVLALGGIWWLLLPLAGSGAAVLLNHATRINRYAED